MAAGSAGQRGQPKPNGKSRVKGLANEATQEPEGRSRLSITRRTAGDARPPVRATETATVQEETEMKALRNMAVALAVVLAAAAAAEATVVQIAEYHLGETGSVGPAGSDYAPLVDSIGGHNITTFNEPFRTTTIVTSPA